MPHRLPFANTYIFLPLSQSMQAPDSPLSLFAIAATTYDSYNTSEEQKQLPALQSYG